MDSVHRSDLARLLRSAIGDDAAIALVDTLSLTPALTDRSPRAVSRPVFAMALNALLFHDLLRRTPTAAAYVADVRREKAQITFDHGALRTIRFASGPTGGLPAGELAFVRILAPLGYELAGVYPLEPLRMTGRAYQQAEFPEQIPQFFLSELHVERFSAAFQTSAHRVFDTSQDPLDAPATAALAQFSANQACPFDLAAAALPAVAAAFGRWHEPPQLRDYETLLAESAEAAWIATEGSAFNHATARVPNVEAVAARQRMLGRPIKERVEVSREGSVRQTAFKADLVTRTFRVGDAETTRPAPGSFFEFITRYRRPGAAHMDLRFDSTNAQGIFKMTAAA